MQNKFVCIFVIIFLEILPSAPILVFLNLRYFLKIAFALSSDLYEVGQSRNEQC